MSVSFSSSVFISWSIFMSDRVNGSYSGDGRGQNVVYGGTR